MQIEKRGTHTKIEDFIKPSVINTNHHYKFDAKNAPDLLLTNMMNGQRITIIGDYDCDGVCASAISYVENGRMAEMEDIAEGWDLL
jgi:single-stranded DNA-specific DHH superfamily exonuclease